VRSASAASILRHNAARLFCFWLFLLNLSEAHFCRISAIIKQIAGYKYLVAAWLKKYWLRRLAIRLAEKR